MQENKIFNRQMVSFWISEIESSEKRKKEELIKRNHYPKLIKYYEGTQHEPEGIENVQGKSQKKLATLNEYFPNTNALLSEIIYQDPDVIAEATKPDAGGNALLMKAALKYGLKKLGVKTENKLALFDMLYAGICGVEIDHVQQELGPEEYDVERNPLDKIIDKGREFLGIEKPTNEDKIAEGVARDTPDKNTNYSTKDKTYLRRWNPLNFGVDYRAERIKDIRFVYKIIRYTKSEFKAKYPDYADKVKSAGSVDYSAHQDPDHKDLITCYEIQRKRKDERYEIFVINTDFKESELSYYIRPYTTNGFNLKIGTLDEYGKLYPVSRAKINKNTQDLMDDYTTFMMEVSERNIPKRGYNIANVTPQTETALNDNAVNGNIPFKGGPESVWTIPATNVSIENKELMGIYQKYMEKGWGVSASRLQGKSDAEFASEINIQEQGFQERRISIQEGLRNLYIAEIETLKDIIVEFWDGEYFFKITGGMKPQWYSPQQGLLTDILTGDYELDVDIISASRPNKEKQRKDLVDYITLLLSPLMAQYLMSKGLSINPDLIKKSAEMFGFTSEMVFIEQGALGSSVSPSQDESGAVIRREAPPESTREGLDIPMEAL